MPITSRAMERLYELAGSQRGYFTSKQAGELQVARQLLAHHLKSGRIERIGRLFRFAYYPREAQDDVYEAWLRLGVPEAVVSHRSAMALHDLGVAAPREYEFIVPADAVVRKIPGTHVYRNAAPLRDIDVVKIHGIRATVPARSVIDASGELDLKQIDQAVYDLLARGLTTPQRLEATVNALNPKILPLFRNAIAHAQEHRIASAHAQIKLALSEPWLAA